MQMPGEGLRGGRVIWSEWLKLPMTGLCRQFMLCPSKGGAESLCVSAGMAASPLPYC